MIRRRQGRRSGDRHHRQLRQGHDFRRTSCTFPGTRGVHGRVAGDHRGGGRVQRARPLHRVHRLRVDLEHRRQQPAPQRHLPRQRRRRPRQVEPYTDVSAARQRQPASTCGSGWTPYEKKTGGNVLAIAHNGNLSNGRMFPLVEAFGKKLDRDYAETRARSGSGSTKRRRPRAPARRIHSCRRTTSSPTSSSGTRATSTAAWRRRRTCSSSSTRAPRLKNGLEARAAARRQSVQVRPDRQQRRAHRPRRDGGGQLLRQDHAAGAEPRADDRDVHRQREDRREGHGLGSRRLRLRRGVGDREHARGVCSTRWSAARPTPRPARAWSCASSAAGTSRRTTRTTALPGGRRLREGRADGRRPARRAAGKRADLPGRRAEGPDRRQPRPHPDRQGLARREGRRCTSRSTTSRGRRGGRKPDADGKLPPVGNTVDVANATWTNTIGAPELITVWKDPELRRRAARVLLRARASRFRRRAGPRTTRSASASSRCPAPGSTVIERAYTAPIWYTP